MVRRICVRLACRRGADARRTRPAADTRAADPRAADIDRQKAQFQGVQETLAHTEAQRKKIEAEIESIQNDRAKLTAASIDARGKIEEAEAQLAASAARLETLAGSENAIRKSLDGRRDVLASVLAVLQRMGRKPPPALLTQPEDVLRAIRASMMLGAVLPQLRAETEALASDLQDLVSLRAAIAQESARQAAEAQARRDERARLDALIAARQQAIGQAQEALAAERKRAQALAGQAANLKELIARMEGELAGARAAAEKARLAEEARARQGEKAAEEARQKFADAQKRDPARLTPAIAFAPGQGPAVAARQRNGHKGLRRRERIRRRGKRTFAGHPAASHCFVSLRWLYRVQRPVALLRSTLDRQRGRRLLCGDGGHGASRRVGRTIRSGGRTGRVNGRRRGANRRGGRHCRDAAGALCRVSQGWDGHRSGAMVDQAG